MKLIAAAMSLVLAVGLAPRAAGQSVHGRLTTSFYAWQRDPSDSTEADHLRAYQLAIIHLEEVADPRLSFHAYARAHGDLLEDVNELAQYRIFNLYGRWKDAARGYEFRGGRQRVYAGVGNVAIDGVFGSCRYRDLATFDAYVGVQTPLAGDGDIAGWDDRAYGGRLTVNRPRDLKIALSFARRQREALEYDDAGVYTGRRLELPEAQEELYGLDASWRFRPGATLYHRLEVDRLQRQLKWGSGILTLAPPGKRWSGDLEYFHRVPSVYANSILSVFSHSDYDEVSARGGYRLAPELRLFASASGTLYDGDSSQRLTAGAEYRALVTSYSRRFGYGGDLNAVSASYRHRLHDKLTLRGEAGVSSFDLYDEQEERNLSFFGAVGGEVRPWRDLAFDLELQNLTQDVHTQAAFAGYKHDLRAHLRVSYGFFTRFGRVEREGTRPAVPPEGTGDSGGARDPGTSP